MLDHVTIGVSDMSGQKHFTTRHCVLSASSAFMATAKPSPAMEPAGKHSSGSAFETLRKPAPMSPSRPRIGKTVEQFHRTALAAGGRDNGPPGLRPHYDKDYYGAFALDPDGHNIEAVCRKPA